MKKELINHILIHSGVTIHDNSNRFDILWKKLQSVFLTSQNKEWFLARYDKFTSKQKQLFCEEYGYVSEKDLLYWELFSFGKLNALKNDAAIHEFNNLKIKECALLQYPNFNVEGNKKPLYSLKGEYDVSFVNDETEFNLLKDMIKKDTAIPYWVIDNISRSIGKEIYVFDISLSWFLVLTHENEVYLYMR